MSFDSTADEPAGSDHAETPQQSSRKRKTAQSDVSTAFVNVRSRAEHVPENLEEGMKNSARRLLEAAQSKLQDQKEKIGIFSISVRIAEVHEVDAAFENSEEAIAAASHMRGRSQSYVKNGRIFMITIQDKQDPGIYPIYEATIREPLSERLKRSYSTAALTAAETGQSQAVPFGNKGGIVIFSMATENPGETAKLIYELGQAKDAARQAFLQGSAEKIKVPKSDGSEVVVVVSVRNPEPI